MKITEGIENVERLPYPILTIGNFDGVHLGHQTIFQMIIKKAKEKNGTSVVLTFEPHPIKVIAPDKSPKLITSFKERRRLIEESGIDVLLYIKFTKEFSNIPAEDFVKNILLDAIGIKEIFIGSNYFFGKGKEGSPELLKKMGKEYGFEVTIIPEIKINDSTVSSSKIRSLISKGNVEEASKFLGRHYSLEGIVVEGAKRGRELFNIPTANIAIFNELLPKSGVYAVNVDIDGTIYNGAANIGYNLTFGGKKIMCEVHVLDFDGNLLGKILKVNLIKRIRDEIKFSKIEDLAVQIQKDIEEIRQTLKET
ncbi:MAG: bifunctional riboflavin kinase/FAD synthetase [Nitrospirae bacterium]|nr:bifunctional riboflavin kinase/FAD synthetase [Nitrospirota bacterium]